MEKLATLYALMQAFQVKLSKEHAMVFLKMIEETNIGAVLLKMRRELGIQNNISSSEDASIIHTKDGSMCVLFVVTNVEKFRPYIAAMEALGNALEARGIHLEVDSWENYVATNEVIPF